MKNYLSKVIFVVCFTTALFGAATAEPNRIYENVEGLFERVAVNPGGKLYDAPNGSVTSAPDAFSVYYVFDQKSVGGDDWLHVGPSAAQSATGWMNASEGTDIRHLLILGPQLRQNRDRALFFESLEDIKAVATSRNRVDDYADLIEDIDNDGAPDGIVGIQPENQPAMSDAFSFMPIRSVEETFIAGLGNRKLYETQSIPLPPESGGNTEFKLGIVFVIDTTTSMGPYIEGVRSMIRDVSESLVEAATDDQVSFGIVGYRDNIAFKPELEYTSKVVHPLEARFDASAFDRAISRMEEAPVSSPDFQEDAIAGLNTALEMPGWEDFERKIIVLVTDAPTRDGDDMGASSTGLSIEAVSGEAEEKRIIISSLFLSTPEGEQYHRNGRRQFRSVSRWENGSSAFGEIQNGDFVSYSGSLDRLISGASDLLGDDAPDCSNQSSLSDIDKVLCEIEDRTAAVRLEWLGRRQGVPAPAVSTAWVSGVSLDSERAATQTMAFQPYLLLTRNQMNDLIRILDELVTVVGPDIDKNREDVLRIFQGALSRGAVNSDLLQAATSGGNAVTLSDYSRMSEFLPAFLSELPLKSPFMELEVGAWININEQAVHMQRISSKITEYRDYLDDDERWIALADGAEYGDLVYPVPWDRIP